MKSLPYLDDEQRSSLWNRAEASGFSRRQFLALLASGGVTVVLAACQSKGIPVPATPPAGHPSSPSQANPKTNPGSLLYSAGQ